ncbi:MAG: CBS domain-containing protein [Dehalococcoidia bacterium]|nr:MAG: CBS domain-containing protein [Dehalococcoidia bacterium]
MFISDVMTSNVITISSKTSLAEARRIMDAHRLRRLPVVDRGKLVGIVTREALDRAGPSKLTSFSIHDITRVLNKVTVKEVMVKDLVTVSPDATVEEAVTLAQEKKVGSLLVIDDGRLVGIATTNDFFYKMLNPILGIGKPGARLVVRNCRSPQDIEKIVGAINKLGLDVITIFMLPIPERDAHSFVIHLSSEDPTGLIAELQLLGFTIERRVR